MKYISLIILVGLFSCNQRTASIDKKKTKYEHLLSKFKEISFDTLQVYSMGEGGEKNYKYNGVQLDSNDVILFPPDIAKAHFIDPPGLFACFKFKIDSSKTGLIARTPSEYYPTSIKLFVYDISKDTLTQFSEIAEYTGDAGALREVSSWIFRDSNNETQLFTWINDSEDNSVENEKDSTISYSNLFTLSNVSKNKHKDFDSAIGKLPDYLKRFVVTKASR